MAARDGSEAENDKQFKSNFAPGIITEYPKVVIIASKICHKSKEYLNSNDIYDGSLLTNWISMDKTF